MKAWLDTETGEVTDMDVPDGTVGPAMTRQRGRHAAEPIKRQPAEENWNTAFLLSLLGIFGLAGMQWLYLRRPLRAVLYFLTFGWFMFGTVWDIWQFHNKTVEELTARLEA